MSILMGRRVACLAIALVTICVGLVWRLAPLHLPFFLYKYGGSVLWAVMVYWLVGWMLPQRHPAVLAGLAAGIAAAVELSRLHHTPGMDAFRLTLAGKLLLGRVFSVWNIVAYWLAVAVAAVVDFQANFDRDSRTLPAVISRREPSK